VTRVTPVSADEAAGVTRYDDPAELAGLVASAPRPLLIGLDVDGVLAPLVDHAHDAILLGGTLEAVSAAAQLEGVHVVVASGRSLEGLAQFGFGPDVIVIGSHGMESRGQPMEGLTDTEMARLARLDELTVAAVERAGTGAWIERKPASVVLHVRQADRALGRAALDLLRSDAEQVDGASAKAGSNVLELFTRHADKGTALVALGAGLGAATTVFVGDDITDEDAFACLGAGDLAIKVGDSDTIATHRLRDPAAVLSWLLALT
jgi:trehalose-phosphatase